MTRRPPKNPDLHGSVPESSPVALLLIDVINDLTFEGSEPLVAQAVSMATRLAALKQRARQTKIRSSKSWRVTLLSTTLDLDALAAARSPAGCGAPGILREASPALSRPYALVCANRAGMVLARTDGETTPPYHSRRGFKIG